MHLSIARLSCVVWGHQVDNRVFERASERERRCRCGASYLAEDGSLTHVRHTLSCFLGKHHYKRLTDRDGCHEYVCVQCGHPLLFRADRDPYAGETLFGKKVRYLCGLFGHRVSVVTTRDGMTEYACHCGHTFLRAEGEGPTIRHPIACVLFAHRIRFLTRRAGFAEYVCRTCGHPFCFADPRS
jgi:DNA-directed RNA polymerase subunit RPC12/RpoP